MTLNTKKNSQENPAFSKAFLIRCYHQGGEWRFMLEDISTRERQVFISVAEMMEWLTAVLARTL